MTLGIRPGAMQPIPPLKGELASWNELEVLSFAGSYHKRST